MRLTINALRKYDIVTDYSYANLKKEIKRFFTGRRILIITDSIVENLYLDVVKKELNEFEVFSFVIQAGEASKNIDNYVKILNFLADSGFLRDDLVLALGGGVVGDLAGFVGATYMRGITLVQCPTTVLSGVDSSVGGKTAVDLAQGKNLVGSFYQPHLTYINLSTFETLNELEVKCGFGEIIKYAYISKSITEELLKEGITEQLIIECLKIKAKIVEEDEFDKGKRALLNLGHTIGHAIETLANFSLSHGSCVLKGISKVIDMSKKFYGLSDDKKVELKKLLNYAGENIDIPYSNEQILEQIKKDKKTESDGVNFLLIKDIGEVRIEKLTFDEIKMLTI